MPESSPAGEATRIAETAYRRLRSVHLSAVQAAMEDHVGRLAWSRETLERFQRQRLRALIGYAQQRSPFHVRRLRDIDPATMEVADLHRLPAMTKQEAQDNWDTIVTTPDLDRGKAERRLAAQQWFSYSGRDHQIFSSGGSSGVRGVYVWDWDVYISIACLAWRMQVRAERLEPLPRSPARLAVLSAGAPPHASTPLFDVPTIPEMTTAVIPAGAPFDEILAAVADYRPTHLVGYATVVGKLAFATLAGDLDIRPVRVSTNSEPLLEEDRAAILQAWNVPVHNLWGSTEIGVQAVGCGLADGLHVCEDEVILERVDENGGPVPKDAPAARTLATGLANKTFPFIRYDLGDQVSWLDGACPCGTALARVADIRGRRDDDFRYATATTPATAFRYVLGNDPQISEYQVRQTPRGAEVLVVGDPDVDALASSVAAALRPHGLSDPGITIRAVDRLPRQEASGKLRRFVPLPERAT